MEDYKLDLSFDKRTLRLLIRHILHNQIAVIMWFYPFYKRLFSWLLPKAADAPDPTVWMWWDPQRDFCVCSILKTSRFSFVPPGLTPKHSTFCCQRALMYLVQVSERRATKLLHYPSSVYNRGGVYCAVRTKYRAFHNVLWDYKNLL